MIFGHTIGARVMTKYGESGVCVWVKDDPVGQERTAYIDSDDVAAIPCIQTLREVLIVRLMKGEPQQERDDG